MCHRLRAPRRPRMLPRNRLPSFADLETRAVLNRRRL